jgi:hypothetical protein
LGVNNERKHIAVRVNCIGQVVVPGDNSVRREISNDVRVHPGHSGRIRVKVCTHRLGQGRPVRYERQHTGEHKEPEANRLDQVRTAAVIHCAYDFKEHERQSAQDADIGQRLGTILHDAGKEPRKNNLTNFFRRVLIRVCKIHS